MSPRVSFGTLKLVAVLVIVIAIVVAAGITVGQAPALFGVDDPPEASITFPDQTTDGNSVEIESVSLSDGGFIVLRDNTGAALVVSEYLEPGTHENLTIERAADGADLSGQLTAVVHQDTTDDEQYVYDATDGAEDRPYMDAGYPVSDSASVTLADRDPEAATDSFRVDSIDGPTSATTNETVTFEGDIRNPIGEDARQPVELRIDGEVRERQLLELDGNENRAISFDIDTDRLEPGDRTIGIYTRDDGALATLAIEYDIEPDLEVIERNDSAVTVNATLPEDGFLTVETDGQDVRGVGEELEAGTHENVTLEFDPDGDETLFVVMYTGIPDDHDPTADDHGFPNADPITVNGDPIRASVPEEDPLEDV
ncbi:DUF7282 domain-containing protein [Natronosalvus amylolyticus]|uniref:DUF7282 domain-containing protein n=1 Tax=Natronosalvus amylolyticus TaxID=2961994 RepID=UPI0020C94298|nr:DUF4179 domain-containing protein [Natronosalvus amylolyticus]